MAGFGLHRFFDGHPGLGAPLGGASGPPPSFSGAPIGTGYLTAQPGSFAPGNFDSAPPVSGIGAPPPAPPPAPGTLGGSARGGGNLFDGVGRALGGMFSGGGTGGQGDFGDRLMDAAPWAMMTLAPTRDAQMEAFGNAIEYTGARRKERREDAEKKDALSLTEGWLVDKMGLSREEARTAARDKEVLGYYMKHAAGPDRPASYDEFTLAQSDPAYASHLAKTKGGATINNMPGASESAFAKTAGQKQAERFVEMADQGVAAQSTIGQVRELRQLGSMIQTGKGAQARAYLGPYAQALGIDVESLGEMQAYQAIVSRIAPTLRVPGSGATSDFEMQRFMESLPSIGNTPEGNELIENTLQALAEHKAQAGDIASRALAGDLLPAQAERAINELGDPLATWRRQFGGQSPGQGSYGMGASDPGGGRGSKPAMSGRSSTGVPWTVR